MTAVLRAQSARPVAVLVDTAPNAAILIESLRSLNYEDTAACCDIIDNSIDADAEKIAVHVIGSGKRQSVDRIIFADNGCGMSRDSLTEAIRLGSDSPHDPSSDLGKFGMGLCTASLGVCRRTTVLSKTSNGELLKAVNDVDQIKLEKRFVSELSVGSPDDEAIFKEYVGARSGTVVIWEKIDNLQKKTVEGLAKALLREAGRIYRYFLTGSRKLTVNGEEVVPVDPLEWDDSKTLRFDEHNLQIEIPNDDGTMAKDAVRIRIAILAESPAEGELSFSRSIAHQGFYVVRNQREIASAETLGLFLKHGEYNRFRAEVSFSGSLDRAFNVGIKKHGIAPVQFLADKLADYLRGQLSTCRKMLRRDVVADVSNEIQEIHNEARQEILKKVKLLTTPDAMRERRERNTSGVTKGQTTKRDETARGPNQDGQPSIANRVRFDTRSMSEGGPIFDSEQRGPTVVVVWNSDHPFYRRFVLDVGSSEKRVVAGMDFLLFCWACAELKHSQENDTVNTILLTIKNEISNNMRVLLK